jgi:predicted lipoprotein with Yx(FWY)xxD motif
VLLASAIGTAASVGTASSLRPPTATIRRTDLGKILADGHGFTLYVFTRDRSNHDTCITVSGCIGVWPILQATKPLRPVVGVNQARLATIRLATDVRQVTYYGHPLYHYSGDFRPGQTNYVGTSQFGGRWYATNAAGRTVR